MWPKFSWCHLKKEAHARGLARRRRPRGVRGHGGEAEEGREVRVDGEPRGRKRGLIRGSSRFEAKEVPGSQPKRRKKMP